MITISRLDLARACIMRDASTRSSRLWRCNLDMRRRSKRFGAKFLIRRIWYQETSDGHGRKVNEIKVGDETVAGNFRGRRQTRLPLGTRDGNEQSQRGS